MRTIKPRFEATSTTRSEQRLKLRSLYNNLCKCPESITAGPVYLLSTTRGVIVTAETYFKHIIPTEYDQPAKTNIWIVLKPINSNEILGIRKIQLDRLAECFKQKGEIATFFRGHSLSTPIELVMNDLLQRIASDTGSEVVSIIDNANIRALAALQRDVIQSGHDPKIEAEYAGKCQEQQRWQVLWGRNGKFGYTHGRKNFKPEAEGITLSKLDQLRLLRTRKDGILIGQPLDEKEIPPHQVTAIQKAKKERLQTTLDRLFEN